MLGDNNAKYNIYIHVPLVNRQQKCSRYMYLPRTEYILRKGEKVTKLMIT